MKLASHGELKHEFHTASVQFMPSTPIKGTMINSVDPDQTPLLTKIYTACIKYSISHE